MSGHQEVTYPLDFCAGRQSRRDSKAFSDRQARDGDAASVPLPRIARLMALAIRLEGWCGMERCGIMRNWRASAE